MSFITRMARLQRLKFSFVKNNSFARDFARNVGAASMYLTGYGLNIPNNLSGQQQLEAIFLTVMNQGGVFLFNLSGEDVNNARKGFTNFADAEINNNITEWELSVILNNKNYLINTIFHNGKIQFKKSLIWKTIMS